MDEHVLDSRVLTDNSVKCFSYRYYGMMHTVPRKSQAKNVMGSGIISIFYNIISITHYFIYHALNSDIHGNSLPGTKSLYILPFLDPFEADYAIYV